MLLSITIYQNGNVDGISTWGCPTSARNLLPNTKYQTATYPFTKLLNYQMAFTGFLPCFHPNAAVATAPTRFAISNGASRNLQYLHETASALAPLKEPYVR